MRPPLSPDRNALTFGRLLAIVMLPVAMLLERWEPVGALVLLLVINSLFPTGSRTDE